MSDQTKTAQELYNCSSAPAPTPSDQVVVTLAEYNQVINGLRMQLHLFAKQNDRLNGKLKAAIAQREDENWTVNACCYIAEAASGWEDTKETHAAIREVKKLRKDRDQLSERSSLLLTQNIALQNHVKNLKADLQAVIKQLRKK